VSLFELSPKMEERDEVEVATGRSTKRPSTLNRYYILQPDHKKEIGHKLICFIFFCSYSKMTIFKF
jgi:hypothetical protein